MRYDGNNTTVHGLDGGARLQVAGKGLAHFLDLVVERREARLHEEGTRCVQSVRGEGRDVSS